MTVIGTRPEIIKLSEIIKKSDLFFNHILVHTGQNYDYELNQIFFEELGIRKPDYYLNVVGNDLGQTMGNVISKSYELMSEILPDAILLLGDTNSCLSVISAKRLKIPVFHMEAGNRCFDLNLPEEINRIIVDHTSDINLCYSNISKNNLIKEGIELDKIFVVGSPMNEIINFHIDKIQNSKVLKKLNLESRKYFVLSVHREENLDNDASFFNILSIINEITIYYNMPIIFSVHPRTRKKLTDNNIVLPSSVIVNRPFGFYDYIELQNNAFCVMSDSGTLAEESAVLKFPAISLRTSTERQEAIEMGVFILSNNNIDNVFQSIDMATKIVYNRKTDTLFEYDSLDVSNKVISLIQSYTQYINNTTWRKS
jgi:UDP-N-acetylglucosamine 2-epimerase (non-hydrolysing)